MNVKYAGNIQINYIHFHFEFISKMPSRNENTYSFKMRITFGTQNRTLALEMIPFCSKNRRVHLIRARGASEREQEQHAMAFK